MAKKVSGYLMAAIILHAVSGFLFAGETDYPSCSKFGVQRFSEKKVAPPFSLKRADGNQVSLSDLKGKPVMFTFWASWCESCREEIPLIEKFSQGKNGQVTVFLVAIDGENEKRIQRLIKDKKITLPVLLDVKEKIARTYGIRMVPTTFFINSEGMMVGMIVGQREWDTPEAWSVMKELFALR
jgi:thiol-disulfide isomerase/thioredoxin